MNNNNNNNSNSNNADGSISNNNNETNSSNNINDKNVPITGRFSIADNIAITYSKLNSTFSRGSFNKNFSTPVSDFDLKLFPFFFKT